MSEYLFRREDTGAVVTVDFATMMAQRDGFVTLPDGVSARRCIALELAREMQDHPLPDAAPSGKASTVERPIVSDSLGFTAHQLADFQADKELHKFTGVEFKPDPHEPTFYQVHFKGRDEWRRYCQHRGMTDGNGSLGSAALLTPGQFERARQRALENLSPVSA